MKGLKRFVVELHRRSVWQVLGIYLAGSWGVLQVVDYMTGFAGLPEWTPSFAFVLLLIGLPVTVGTAFIQEGMPGQAYEDEVDPNELEGMTPEEVHRNPRAHPLAKDSVFTWRNAILGGVGAGVLLICSVAAYLTMWALGIGPVGSLVAQGVLEERDPVILAEFENRTDDPTLAAAITDAFRVDLLESQVVTLLDAGSVKDVLGRMDRPLDTRLTGEVAREVAVREGIKAVVEGEVSLVGGGYLLAARIVRPDNGQALAGFRETASDDGELLPAIDRLSQQVREKAGESLRDIRTGEGLEAVTTSSLDALRKFAEANRADEEGDTDGAIALLNEAVALDSTFAMAHRKLAVLYSNRGGDYAAQVQAATAAYEHRARLTDRERYLAEAYYHYTVTDDDEAMAGAYRRVLDGHPHDPAALNNLSLYHLEREEWEEAVVLLLRAVDGPGRSRAAYNNLVLALYNSGRKAEAKAVLADWLVDYAPDFSTHRQRFHLEWGMGNLDAAEAAGREGLEALGDEPFSRINLRQRLGWLAETQGRLGEARSHHMERRSLAERIGAPRTAFFGALDVAGLDIRMGGDTARVLRRLEARLDSEFQDIDPLNRPYDVMGFVWAVLGGDAGRARHWWAAADSVRTEEMKGEAWETEQLLHRALLDLVEGRYAAAVEGLEEHARRSDCTDCNLRWRARALMGAGRSEEAIGLYERWLARDEFDFLPNRGRWLVDVAPRLARAYEEAGRLEDARDAWMLLADQWADGDEAAQRYVRRARAEIRRLEGLMGGTG